MKTVKKKQVKLASKAIAEMQLRKIKTINRDDTAYSLKHLFEKYLRANEIVKPHEAYISEGAGIKAMTKAGFTVGFDKYNRTCFNVSKADVNRVEQSVKRLLYPHHF